MGLEVSDSCKWVWVWVWRIVIVTVMMISWKASSFSVIWGQTKPGLRHYLSLYLGSLIAELACFKPKKLHE